jgi:glutamate synthase (NADPH/NADH) small chain
MAGVSDAVDFIADLRQAGDLTQLPIGRNVVVIGGGMTAIDAGVQSKLLGAETVTIVYRRGQEAMSASPWEQELAASRGVTIRHWAKPLRVTGNGAAREVEFEYTRAGASGLEGTGETFRLSADQVFKAIGQTLDGAPDGLALEGGKIQTDAEGRTSLPGIWAGGDCATGGDDLTVTAVAEGRDAADSIHAALSN